ncbi:unnamed protein product [Cyprideis torosa]|uniref:Fe2OG dioxygenase domain-containing protein n=1 Tax=Cyprideis torosa TaxID=163714 RepID=A0A7R8ZNU2_9CRUS|nr:unnamed protein product [Cyprideis torosa]CAG0892376.1 unnamed protein product [Cyprideis torosa]
MDMFILCRVIAFRSGLFCSGRECLVLNPGGHFKMHVDPLSDDHNPFGDRLATFLMFLNDVPLGGRTVFPVINVTLKPKKGSAVFFWDLQRNGGDDSLTFHEACPVVIGEKWISTKWFHELGNDKVLPCSVEAEDTGLDDLKSKLLEEIEN